MEKGFSGTLRELTKRLNMLQTETEESAWEQLVRFCSRKTMERRVVEPVEKAVHEYISELTEEDKRNVWSDTLTGQIVDDNETQWTIDEIERDLENELLSGVIELAYKEYDSAKRKRKKE